MKRIRQVVAAACGAWLAVFLAVPAMAALTFTEISGEKTLAVDSAENYGKTNFQATADVTLKLAGSATDGEFPLRANIYVPDAATTVTIDISDVTGDCTVIRMTGGIRGAGTVVFGEGVKTLRFGDSLPTSSAGVIHLVALEAPVSFTEQDGAVEFVQSASLLFKPASYTIADGATVAPFVAGFFDEDELTLDRFDLVLCSEVSVKSGCTITVGEGRRVYHRPASVRSPTGSDISTFSQWSGQSNHRYALDLVLDGGTFETQTRTVGCAILGDITGNGDLVLSAPGGSMEFKGRHAFTGAITSKSNNSTPGTITFTSSEDSTFENVDVRLDAANNVDILLFAPESGTIGIKSVTGRAPNSTGGYHRITAGADCKLSIGLAKGSLAFDGDGGSAEVELVALDALQIQEFPGVTLTLDGFDPTCSLLLRPQGGAENVWGICGGADVEIRVPAKVHSDVTGGEVRLGGKIQLPVILPFQTVRILKDAEVRVGISDGAKIVNEGGSLELLPSWTLKAGLWFDVSDEASLSNALDHVNSKGWQDVTGYSSFTTDYIYEWFDCRPEQRTYRIRATKYDKASASLTTQVFPRLRSDTDDGRPYLSWWTASKTRTPLAGGQYTTDRKTYSAKTIIAVFGSQLGGGNAMLTTESARLARTTEAYGTGYKADWPICLDTTVSVRTNGVPVTGSETGFSGGWQIVTLETDDAVSVKGIAHPSEYDVSEGNGGQQYRELLVFSERLTEAERFEVEKYLAEKWGQTIVGEVPKASSQTFDFVGSGSVSLGGNSAYGSNGWFKGTLDLNGRRFEIGDVRVPCSDADVPADGRLLWVDPRYEGAVVFADDGYGSADEVKMIYTRDNEGLLTADKSIYMTSPIKDDGSDDRRVRFVNGWLDFRNGDEAKAGNALFMKRLPYERMDDYADRSALQFEDVFGGFFAVDSSSNYGGTLMTSQANGTGGDLIRRASSSDPTLNFRSDVKDQVELDIALDGVSIDAKTDGFSGRKETLSFCVTNGYDLTVKVFGHHNVANNEILGEWMLYSRALSADERADVESYLMKKWQGVIRPGFVESREMTVVGDGVVAVGNPKSLPELGESFTGTIELTRTTWGFTLEQGSAAAVDAWTFPGRTVTAPAAVTVDLDVSAARQGKFLLASAETFAAGTAFTLGTLVNPRDRIVALVREGNALYATVEPKGLLLIVK